LAKAQRPTLPPNVVPLHTDPTDFEAIYRRYARYSAAIAYRLMGRSSEVDDLVQEVFVDVLEGMSKIRDPGALRAWIATITVRKARRRLRWLATRRLFGFDDVLIDDVLVDQGPGPEANALLQSVFRSLDRIAVDDRIAWILRHIEGLSLDEIAHHCSCSVATVKRRITRAQKHVEEVFNDR